MFVQLGLGGLGTLSLEPLVPTYGLAVIWVALMSFPVVTLVLLPFLDTYPLPSAAEGRKTRWQTPRPVVVLVMCGIFCCQMSQMMAFSFLIELGRERAIVAELMDLAVAANLWVGIPAAFVVAWWSIRSGRLASVAATIILTATGVACLQVPGAAMFVIGNVGFGFFCAMTIPYILGLAAEMDQSGQMSALGGFASKVGLATGPFVGACLLAATSFVTMLTLTLCTFAASLVLLVRPARFLDRSA